MARPTHDEIIHKLSGNLASLETTLEFLGANIQRVDAAHAKTADTVGDLHRRIAVAEDRVSDLRKAQEETSRKRWALLPPVVGGVVGALLTLLANLLVSYLRK